MPCWKCIENEWPDPQDAICKDENGMELCIFHAPLTHKNISADAFRELVFTRIDSFNTTSGPESICIFSGTIFTYNLNIREFNSGNITPNIKFDHATFNGLNDFSDTTFNGNVSLACTKFNFSSNFKSTKFNSSADFVGAIFKESVNFEDTQFNGKARFMITKFMNFVYFDSATFNDIAIFNNSKFEGTTLISSKFNNNAYFNMAIFKKDVRFGLSEFSSKTDFKNTRFEGAAEFSGTKFGALTSFKNTCFDGITTFTVNNPGAQLSFRGLKSVKDMRFSNMDMFSVDLINIPINNIRFQNVKWKKSLDESRYYLPIEDNPEHTGIQHGDTFLNDALRYSAVSEFYRQMKKRCRDEQNDAEASLWHYAEKEVQLKLHRLEKPYSFQRFMLEIYRAISRYGEDPRQAGEVLFYLLVVLFSILAFGGFHHLGKPPFDITSERVSNLFLTFVQYALFIKPIWTPPPVYDVFALLFSRLLIPIQAAIFAFALRNKLHR